MCHIKVCQKHLKKKKKSSLQFRANSLYRDETKIKELLMIHDQHFILGCGSVPTPVEVVLLNLSINVTADESCRMHVMNEF